MSIYGNVCSCLTRCLPQHRRIEAHVKEVSVRQEDAVSRHLDHRFVIDTIHKKVTVSKHTDDTLLRECLKIVRIGCKVARMKPQLCIRSTMYGKHLLEYARISVAVTDNSNSHTTPLSISNAFIMSSAAPR